MLLTLLILIKYKRLTYYNAHQVIIMKKFCLDSVTCHVIHDRKSSKSPILALFVTHASRNVNFSPTSTKMTTTVVLL